MRMLFIISDWVLDIADVGFWLLEKLCYPVARLEQLLCRHARKAPDRNGKVYCLDCMKLLTT